MYLPGLGLPINEDWNTTKAARQAVEQSLSPRSKPDGLVGREADASQEKIAERPGLMRRDEDADGRARDNFSNTPDLDETHGDGHGDAKDKTGKKGKKKRDLK